jgi:hypothetical protein
MWIDDASRPGELDGRARDTRVLDPSHEARGEEVGANVSDDAADPKSPSATSEVRPRDRAVILGPVEGDKGLAVLRQRAEGAPVEAGIVKPLEEGRPIAGEVVRLKPTAEDPRVCDVEVHLDRRGVAHKGPARVATNAYRDGWDALFASDRGDAPGDQRPN